MFTAANRANCAIYALDPRGLAAFEFDIDQGVGQQLDKAALDAGLDTLRTLADETDGRAILNSNDLVKGLAQMVKDASSYYLLGYTASSPTDGKFKQIKVRVKRPGLQVRARKGYWALSTDDVAAVTAAATRVGPGAGDWRCAGADRDAAPGPDHPHLDRHGARRERPHGRHAGLGAGARDDRRAARAAGAAGGHGGRAERRGLLPRQGAGRRGRDLGGATSRGGRGARAPMPAGA